MDAKIFLDHVINGFFKADYNSNKLYYMIMEASNLIKTLDTKSLFIIDEAGNFKPQMHKYIREFRDKTKDHSGLIISGPTSFYRDLDDYRKKDKYGISEMMSRIDYWVELDPPSPEDKKAICEANGLIDDNLITKFTSTSSNFRTLNKKIEAHIRDLQRSKSNAKIA